MMADNRIIVRTGKNVLFKSKKYNIKVNGADTRVINSENTQEEYILPIGKYTLEIGNENSSKTTELILSTGQTKTFTIHPSVTYPLGIGFLVGIAVVSIFVQFLILDKISIPLMLVPFIPLMLTRKRNFADSFEITASK